MDATNVGVLTDDDRACLNELGAYLVSTDAWQRFAIWLLHKHFEPAPGEVFVERTITQPPQTHTGPIERTALSTTSLRATALRFDAGVSAGIGLVGMEFAAPADFGSTSQLNRDDETVLAGLAERLQSQSKTGRFGIRLVRNPLGLSDNDVLLETCDLYGRTLHREVIDRGDIPSQGTIETTWQFKPVIIKTRPTVTMACRSTCTSVCLTASGTHHSGG